MTYVSDPWPAARQFASHYRSIAAPRIKREIDTLAVLVDADSLAFDEAYDEAILLADKLGSEYLPRDILADLHGWLLTQLTEAVIAAKERGDRAREALKRAELANPVAYYEKLASGSAKPEAMRWALAAVSAEYRTHLVKCRANR